MAQITVDYSNFEVLQEALRMCPREAKVALSLALNRTISKTITYIHDEVSKEYTIKRVGVKKSLSIKKANMNNLQAEAISKGSRLKISNFPFKASGSHRLAVVQIKKGQKLSKSNPPLFVGRANKTTGRREVFKRTPNTPYKIGFGFTVSIPQMIANEDVYDVISYKSELFLAERFERELEQKFRRISASL